MRPGSSRDQERIEATPEVTPEATPEVRLLMALAGEMTRQTIQSALALKDDEHFRKAYLLPALEAGFIEMTIPDKPRSPKQRYRITRLGQEVLKRAKQRQ
ncbi:MAG: Fic family protein [Thermodesulfobacteriota bacterium]